MSDIVNDATESFAKELAASAGQIIRTAFLKGGISKDWKPDNTPLTQTDIDVHRLVVSQIAQRFPDHSLLSEENEDVQTHIVPDADYVWVCDPIDGTLPFSHGVPISTFSLALTYHGEVVLGVAYDPYLDRLFSARKGGGTYLNGSRVNVSSLKNLKTGVISLEGLPNDYDGEIYHNLRDRSVGAKVVTLQSTVLAGSLVANGSFVATIFGREKPWDVAALKILVEEAGGKATDLFGNEQRYDQTTKGFVATNGATHQQLLDILAECRRLAGV